MYKKRILFTASIPAHIKSFHLPYLKWFQEQGFETHVACNGIETLPYVDKVWQIDFIRSPFSIRHFHAYRQLKKVIDSNEYVMINCHTPMTSILTRLATRSARGMGTKLIYTAHGFHFFKGAPLINWLVYYPIEKYLTKYTDAIITINLEDFNTISKVGAKKCAYYLVPGVGVKGDRFYPINSKDKIALRKLFNLNIDDFVLVYAAEYISRKNHRFIIEAVNKYREKLDSVKILFAGKGELEDSLNRLVQNYKLEGSILFLGFRKDIDKIYQVSDLCVSSSKQEGLPINIVEAMLTGLPIVASIERGHNELLFDKVNGLRFDLNDMDEFVKNIITIKNNYFQYHEMSENSLKIGKKFEINNSLLEITSIYKKYI